MDIDDIDGFNVAKLFTLLGAIEERIPFGSSQYQIYDGMFHVRWIVCDETICTKSYPLEGSLESIDMDSAITEFFGQAAIAVAKAMRTYRAELN